MEKILRKLSKFSLQFSTWFTATSILQLLFPPWGLLTRDSLGFPSPNHAFSDKSPFLIDPMATCLQNRCFNQGVNGMLWILTLQRKQFVLHCQNLIINQFLKISFRWFLGFLSSGKIKCCLSSSYLRVLVKCVCVCARVHTRVHTWKQSQADS